MLNHHRTREEERRRHALYEERRHPGSHPGSRPGHPGSRPGHPGYPGSHPGHPGHPYGGQILARVGEEPHPVGTLGTPPSDHDWRIGVVGWALMEDGTCLPMYEDAADAVENGHRASIGVIWTQAELDARVNQLNTDIEGTEDAIVRDARALGRPPRVVCTDPEDAKDLGDLKTFKIPGIFGSSGTPLVTKDCKQVPPLTDGEKARMEFARGEWFPFKLDWNDFQAKGFKGWNESRLSWFEDRYRQLRARYAAMPGAVIPPPPSDKKKDEEGPLDQTLVFLKKLGILVAVGLAAWYLLPPLLAWAATKIDKKEGDIERARESRFSSFGPKVGSPEERTAALPPAPSHGLKVHAGYGEEAMGHGERSASPPPAPWEPEPATLRASRGPTHHDDEHDYDTGHAHTIGKTPTLAYG
jgi:hypothetical protein